MSRPRSIKDYASLLTLSEDALKRKRRQLRMENPDNIEARLLAWLRATYEEHRDKVNRLAKGSGYTEFWSGSMGASQRHQLGNLHQEPEAIPNDLQEEYSRNGWHTFDVLKGEELARREVRARAERLRQAELELRQKGKPAEHYARAVDDVIAAMKREAKAV